MLVRLPASLIGEIVKYFWAFEAWLKLGRTSKALKQLVSRSRGLSAISIDSEIEAIKWSEFMQGRLSQINKLYINWWVTVPVAAENKEAESLEPRLRLIRDCSQVKALSLHEFNTDIGLNLPKILPWWQLHTLDHDEFVWTEEERQTWAQEVCQTQVLKTYRCHSGRPLWPLPKSLEHLDLGRSSGLTTASLLSFLPRANLLSLSLNADRDESSLVVKSAWVFSHLSSLTLKFCSFFLTQQLLSLSPELQKLDLNSSGVEYEEDEEDEEDEEQEEQEERRYYRPRQLKQLKLVSQKVRELRVGGVKELKSLPQSLLSRLSSLSLDRDWFWFETDSWPALKSLSLESGNLMGANLVEIFGHLEELKLLSLAGFPVQLSQSLPKLSLCWQVYVDMAEDKFSSEALQDLELINLPAQADLTQLWHLFPKIQNLKLGLDLTAEFESYNNPDLALLPLLPWSLAPPSLSKISIITRLGTPLTERPVSLPSNLTWKQQLI